MGIATITFILCMAATIAIGMLALTRGKKTSVDYLLASRDHGAIVTSLSASATDVSGWVLMGLVGMSFRIGISALWVLPAGLLGYYLNWGLVARRLRAISVEQGSETFPEFLASGFSGKSQLIVRLLASLVILVFLTYYLSGQFNACGKALKAYFNISYEWGVLAALAIIFPYIIVAGMRGTSWTDVVQAVLIAIAVIIVPIVALHEVGGLSSLYGKLKAIDPSLVSWTSDKRGGEAILYVLFWISIGAVYPGQPHILTRFMAAKDTKSLSRGRWIAICWFLLVASMAVLVGLAAKAGFADTPKIAEDAEQILPVLAGVFLPSFFVGIVLAAVTAAIMTTADSMVLVIISTLLADANSIIGKKKANYFSLTFRAVVGIVVASSATILAFLSNRSVFTVVLDAWAIIGSTFTIVVFYRLWVKNPSAISVVVGMALGLISALFLNGDHYQIQIIVSLGISLLGVVLTHMLCSRIPAAEEGSTDTSSNEFNERP